MRPHARDHTNESSTVEVRGHINADEMLFVRQAIGGGMGIGLLPQVVIASCERAGHLAPVQRVLPEYAMSGAVLSVLTPSGHRRPRRVTLLRDFLVERLTPRCESQA